MRVRDFVRLGHRDQFRLLAVWSLLGLCRLVIVLLPFRTIRHLLGEDRATEPTDSISPPPPALSPVETARAHRMGQMILVASRHTPWRSECYPQALTARILLGLRRIPHRISFGLRRDGAALTAHVWVRAGEVAVTGGDGRDYTEVASFLWVPRRRASRVREQDA